MTASLNSSCDSVFSYLQHRQSCSNVELTDSARERCIARQLPLAITEKEVPLGLIDKVFAAQWLDPLHVACGTKCNKLIVQNIRTRQVWDIPLLEGSGNVRLPDKNCGIHTVSLNLPSSLLVTGACNPNSIGIYKLPSLDPVCVGEMHTDWVFTSAWLSDGVLATGSRDKSIALWSLPDEMRRMTYESAIERPSIITPVHQIHGVKALEKIRALVFNPYYQHVASIASNGYLYIWDALHTAEVASFAMPFTKENVCIAHQQDNLLYAVGSLSHVTLLETKSGRPVASLCSKDQGAGVRSVSFHNCIVTIGTGYGSLVFYDIRMNKMLQRNDGSLCRLKAGRGWLRRDAVYQEFFWENECYPNAIYAHCYDPTQMRLFTAGGPLALGLYGNYAAYWD